MFIIEGADRAKQIAEAKGLMPQTQVVCSATDGLKVLKSSEEGIVINVENSNDLAEVCAIVFEEHKRVAVLLPPGACLRRSGFVSFTNPAPCLKVHTCDTLTPTQFRFGK